MSELSQLSIEPNWQGSNFTALQDLESLSLVPSSAASSEQTASPSLSRSSSRSQPLASGAWERFLNSPKFSDLTVRYEGRAASVHKVLLCAQSSWFAKACEGNFMEASQNTITLYDDDADGIDAMLSYCYGGSGLPRPDCVGASRLTTLVGTHSAADKYDVAGLRDVTVQEFRRELEAQWMHLWAAEELSFVIIAVYSCSPDPRTCRLCQAIVELLHKHLQEMKQQDPEKLRSLMEENPEMAADFILKLALSGPATLTNVGTPAAEYVDDGMGACAIEEAMSPVDHRDAFVLTAAACGIRVL